LAAEHSNLCLLKTPSTAQSVITLLDSKAPKDAATATVSFNVAAMVAADS
jgi:hypothetical protein